MTVTAITPDAGEPARPPLHALARGLRTLLISGQHFRGRRAEELQLGSSDLEALGHLYHEGSLAPGRLSALMGVTSGTMTALLDRVEKAGFLRREPNPQDRRGRLIVLTPAGQHAMHWLYDQFEDVIRHALAGVPDLDVEQFHAVLELLAGSLDAGNHPHDPSGATTPRTPIHPL
ncbi:hypothetical protein GCM10011374_36840 [Kocuria dechangensis]|uniref:HTH marR-type domain-containing protein n=2 Tax=Kocuria dechangensis TaxID=1176249 RepID=A0A917H6Z4_9MICC|nr:hypothetical protein GCM10011374_36840 [Kocuria dechangensis]